MSKRRGFTLNEAIVVIGMMAILMTMSATTVFHLLEMEAHGNQALVVSTTLSRLASDFRRDVHAAKNGTGLIFSKQAAAARSRKLDLSRFVKLRLEMPDQRVVEYQAGEDRVVRQVCTAKDGGQGQPFRTETYALPQSANHFETSRDRTLIAFVHARLVRLPGGQNENGAAERSFRIEAVVGRDHRFGRKAQ